MLFESLLPPAGHVLSSAEIKERRVEIKERLETFQRTVMDERPNLIKLQPTDRSNKKN